MQEGEERLPKSRWCVKVKVGEPSFSTARDDNPVVKGLNEVYST